MRTSIVHCFVLVALLIAITVNARADEHPCSVRSGDHVRVTILADTVAVGKPDGPSSMTDTVMVGTFMAASRDEVMVWLDGDGVAWAIPSKRIQRLELWKETSRANTGMGLGLVMGAFVGIGVGAGGDDPGFLGQEPAMVAGGVIGGLMGAVIGRIIGASIRNEYSCQVDVRSSRGRVPDVGRWPTRLVLFGAPVIGVALVFRIHLMH